MGVPAPSLHRESTDSLIHVRIHVVVCLLKSLMVGTIDNWNESKLEEVVQKKHGGKTKPKTNTVSGYLFLHLYMYMYINIVHCFPYIHNSMGVHVHV